MKRDREGLPAAAMVFFALVCGTGPWRTSPPRNDRRQTGRGSTRGGSAESHRQATDAPVQPECGA